LGVMQQPLAATSAVSARQLANRGRLRHIRDMASWGKLVEVVSSARIRCETSNREPIVHSSTSANRRDGLDPNSPNKRHFGLLPPPWMTCCPTYVGYVTPIGGAACTNVTSPTFRSPRPSPRLAFRGPLPSAATGHGAVSCGHSTRQSLVTRLSSGWADNCQGASLFARPAASVGRSQSQADLAHVPTIESGLGWGSRPMYASVHRAPPLLPLVPSDLLATYPPGGANAIALRARSRHASQSGLERLGEA
jgi:hypothetical protein